MDRRRIVNRGVVLAIVTAAAFGVGAVHAGDFQRQMGVGYGAGYHAPAPFVQSPAMSTSPGWLGWKSAGSHPGGMMQGGCGCGPSGFQGYEYGGSPYVSAPRFQGGYGQFPGYGDGCGCCPRGCTKHAAIY